MTRIGGFLSALSVAVAGTAGVAFLSYRNELARARATASRGSLVANLDMGPIEYAENGAGRAPPIDPWQASIARSPVLEATV
jgi:2-hydroxy-6-oxonona-2,4-dienedioate hydrolase